MPLTILARSSSEAPALAAMASCFHRPIRRPGAFFSLAIAFSPESELAGPDIEYIPFRLPATGCARQFVLCPSPVSLFGKRDGSVHPGAGPAAAPDFRPLI